MQHSEEFVCSESFSSLAELADAAQRLKLLAGGPVRINSIFKSWDLMVLRFPSGDSGETELRLVISASEV